MANGDEIRQLARWPEVEQKIIARRAELPAAPAGGRPAPGSASGRRSSAIGFFALGAGALLAAALLAWRSRFAKFRN